MNHKGFGYRKIALLVVLVATVGFLANSALADEYQVENVPISAEVGSDVTEAMVQWCRNVNNTGIVVGHIQHPAGPYGGTPAFYHVPGETHLRIIGDEFFYAEADDISNENLITGYLRGDAYVYDIANQTYLDGFDSYIYGHRISDSGDVLVSSVDDYFLVLADGTEIPLGQADHYNSFGMNTRGDLAITTEQGTFLYQDGAPTSLPVPPDAYVVDLNDQGEILLRDNLEALLLESDGTLTTLGQFFPRAIANTSTVVGVLGGGVGVVWERENGLRLVADVVDDDASLLESVRDIDISDNAQFIVVSDNSPALGVACQRLRRTVPGDLNCDGLVDFADINPFVTALNGEAYYTSKHPGCRWLNADVNGDGAVTFVDINPFIALLNSGAKRHSSKAGKDARK